MKKGMLAIIIAGILIVGILAAGLAINTRDGSFIKIFDLSNRNVRGTEKESSMTATDKYEVSFEFSKNSIIEKCLDIEVKNLQDSSDELSLKTILNETNFDINEIGNIQFYESKSEEVLRYNYEEVCNPYDETNINGTSQIDNCTQIITGNYTEEVWNWESKQLTSIDKEGEIELRNTWEQVSIQKLGNVKDTIKFRMCFNVPITKTNEGWGNKGTVYLDINEEVFYDKTYSSWWNGDWGAKKEINITENSGKNFANYSVYLNLSVEASMYGVEDLRFVDSSETLELDHWVDTNDSSYIEVWVETNLTGSSETIIYVYYNNPTASSTSDISSTFLAGTDCEYDDPWTNGWDDIGNSNLITTDNYSISGNKSCFMGIPGVGRAAVFNITSPILADINLENNISLLDMWLRPTNDENTYYPTIFNISDPDIADFTKNAIFNTISSSTGGSKFRWFYDGGWTVVGDEYTFEKFHHSILISNFTNYTNNWTVYAPDNVTKLVGEVHPFTSVGVKATSIDSIAWYTYNVGSAMDKMILRKYTESEPTYVIGDEIVVAPKVTLHIPADNAGFTVNQVEFNCSATTFTDLNNISLYIDGEINETIAAAGTYDELNITLNFAEGKFNWTCSATDDVHALGWAVNQTFSIDTIDPVMEIVFPATNNTDQSNELLDVNFTRSDENLAYCWYSNDTYEVNITLASCGNVTDVTWSQGNHNITIWVNDTAGHEVSDGISFTIDSVNPDINITFPINNSNWTINTVDVNFTRSDTNLAYCWYSNDTYEVNITLASCGNLTDIIWSEGNHNVSIWANDTLGNENVSRISFTIDAIVPEVNITYPLTHVNYQEINTNLTINYSASDLNLESCWGSFDGGTNNISLTCTDQNITRNITSVNNDTFSFWANDTFGNIGDITRTWIYRVFENQQTYSSTTIPGSTETFVNNILLGSGETITEVNFNYNGTDRSAGYSNLGGGEYNLSSTFVIPSVAATINITFFWKIDLISGQINTSSNNQSIRNIAIDDCSVFTTVIFNYTIIDEESQTKLTINTSLELDIDIFDAAGTTLILNFSKEYIDTNPATVCLNINLTEGADYSLDSTAKYSAANHSIEYYNIQNFLLQNATIPQHIKLFDLHDDDTTEFQITFKDSSFVVVENALVQINRQYISEGVFKTVEIPKTDSNGQTVVHLVEKDVVYNIIVLKEGEVIGTFNNVIAFCEDVLIGSCFITLNAWERGEVSFDYDEEIGLFYGFDYNETSRNLRFDFTTIDGSVKNVTLSAIKYDQLGDTAVCDGYLISSGGSIYCPVPGSVGNETIIVSIWVDGDLKITNYVEAGREFDIGDAGYFLMFFLVLSLALMMTQSKTGVVVGVILGFISGTLLSLIQGGLIGVGSSVIWLIIMGVILIYKLNSKGQT